MPKFRKKPIVIEAEQFLPDAKPPQIPDGVHAGQRPLGGSDAWIDTLEGKLYVSPEDWIITGVKGEKYPCKRNIFEETYEEVKAKNCPSCKKEHTNTALYCSNECFLASELNE